MENQNQTAVVATASASGKQSVLAAMANRLSIEPNKLMDVLKKTAFSTCRTNEEFISMCVVANKYGLDPITKEIYAFPNKGGSVVPIVGYDGWVKMANSNPNFDGVEFDEAEDASWCECRIYRKDRTHPTIIREWRAECDMGTMPWKKYPRRMLRNKAFNQCARIAFGYAGIYDPDEAERIRMCEPETGEVVATATTRKRVISKRPATVASMLAHTPSKTPVQAQASDDSKEYEETIGNAVDGVLDAENAIEGEVVYNPAENAAIIEGVM